MYTITSLGINFFLILGSVNPIAARFNRMRVKIYWALNHSLVLNMTMDCS